LAQEEVRKLPGAAKEVLVETRCFHQLRLLVVEAVVIILVPLQRMEMELLVVLAVEQVEVMRVLTVMEERETRHLHHHHKEIRAEIAPLVLLLAQLFQEL